MINYKEARVNNWIMYNNRLFQIEAISRSLPCLNTDEFGIGVVDWNNIQPIVLSPEILEKCGFKLEKKQWAINVGGELFNYAFIEGFVVFAKNKNYNELTIDSVIKPRRSRFINSLHQLQNLYFALTGEELNYTP